MPLVSFLIFSNIVKRLPIEWGMLIRLCSGGSNPRPFELESFAVTTRPQVYLISYIFQSFKLIAKTKETKLPLLSFSQLLSVHIKRLK